MPALAEIGSLLSPSGASGALVSAGVSGSAGASVSSGASVGDSTSARAGAEAGRAASPPGTRSFSAFSTAVDVTVAPLTASMPSDP